MGNISVGLKKKMIFAVAAGAVLAALTGWHDYTEDQAAKGYVMRNAYGQGDKNESLTLVTDGKKVPVTLHLKEQAISKKKARELLKEEKAKLAEKVLGKQKASHVSRDLKLPDSLLNGLIEVHWMSDHPEYVDWDGSIEKDIPRTGVQVNLTATLLLNNESTSFELPLTVFPNAGGGIAEKAKEEVENTNKSTVRKVMLPTELNGRPVRWQSENSGNAVRVFALGIAAALLLWYSDVHKEEQAREMRRKNLASDYPSMMSQLVLFLGAGLSMRSAFERFERSGRIQTEKDKERHPGYAEAARCAQEMQHGITEKEAYERFGKRTELPEYRAAASLFIQNQQKGGREILRLLNENAKEAQIKRRSEAKVMGEAAGTKLLVPMVGLLVLVVAILMIPAMMNFSL